MAIPSCPRSHGIPTQGSGIPVPKHPISSCANSSFWITWTNVLSLTGFFIVEKSTKSPKYWEIRNRQTRDHFDRLRF